MAGKSKIEWTGRTWNPVVGCSLVSPGCTNCYAMGQAHRVSLMAAGAGRTSPYDGLTRMTKAGAVWTGELRLVDDVLTAPLRWRQPQTIFVNSMSDLFHESIPFEAIDRIFAVMLLARQHTYQVLTKRPERMREYLSRPGTAAKLARINAIRAQMAELEPTAPPLHDLWFQRHIWLGISAEDQARYLERREHLFECYGFGRRFLSAEPLIGPIDLDFRTDHCDLCGGTGILARWPKGACHECSGKGRKVIAGPPRQDGYRSFDWVIVGGESGRKARPVHPDWVRRMRDACAAAGVPFFFKQWGEFAPVYDRDREDPDWRRCAQVADETPRGRWLNIAGGQGFHGQRVVRVNPVGKGRAGRELDGRIHDDMPRKAA